MAQWLCWNWRSVFHTDAFGSRVRFPSASRRVGLVGLGHLTLTQEATGSNPVRDTAGTPGTENVAAFSPSSANEERVPGLACFDRLKNEASCHAYSECRETPEAD
jgi:hypothetical protein